MEIDAASHTGVDNVRENIINNSRFTPTSRKFKVFIIDEVHMLSISAFNALLKTLEEPPAHAIFILATTEIYKVPQTIISRCQHFDFRKVSELEIAKRLNFITEKEGKVVSQSILENIAYYAEGGIRDAESLLGQILSLGDKEITAEQAELVLPRSRFDLVLEFIEFLNRKDSAGAIGLINRLVSEGIDLDKFTGDLIEVLRKILLMKVSSQLNEFTGGLSKDLEKRAIEVSSQISLEFLIKIIEIILVKKQELKFADILQLPLELAVLEIIGDDSHSDDKPQGGGGSGLKTEPILKIEESEVKEKEPEKETPKIPIAKVKLTLDQVKEKWEEVLICLKKYNQSLASTLRISQPSTVGEDGILEVCFRHKFHQQRVNDNKNRLILEQVLRDVFGVQLIVRTAVVKDLPEEKVEVATLAEAKTSQDSIDNVLQSFGGQLVE
ncbi:MAG: DNA polymerase III subunit gamma/tau [Candidatus Buchananbacteria bacterium]